MRTVIVIPARLGSKRLPGKALAAIGGVPLVVHTARRAMACRRATEVLVATCSEEIARVARAAGIAVVMTGAHPTNGTERVYSAWQQVGGEVVVNLQVDEPGILPADLDALVAHLAQGRGTWATLRRPLDERRQWQRPDVVKVICRDDGRALYFSRAPLPRECEPKDLAAEAPPPAGVFAHVGVYAFTREALARYAALPPHPLERAERLEQLRGLAAGMSLDVLDARTRAHGIDTLADLEAAQAAARELADLPAAWA